MWWVLAGVVSVGLGQGVEFRFLGAQEGALRALGVCDPRARLPWLVRSRSGDQDHYDDAALREWAARQYSTTTTAALRIPEESPRHRPRAVDTLASAFALGKSLGRKDVHVATISNTTKATTTLEAASSPHQIGGDVKNDLRSGDLGGSFRGDDDNGGRRGRRSRIIEVQQWNFFHLPKCAGTALIGALEREAKAHGIKTCNGHSQAESECANSDAGLMYGHQYSSLSSNNNNNNNNSLLAASHEETTTTATAPSVNKKTKTKTFTFLRHPLARVPSLYHYIRRSKHHHLHSMVVNQTLLEFLAFQQASDSVTGGEATNEMTRMLCGPRAGPDALRCSTDRDWAVKRAKERLLQDFAFVGIQECFPESLSLVADAVSWAANLNPNLNLHHLDAAAAAAAAQQRINSAAAAAAAGGGGGVSLERPGLLLSGEELAGVLAQNEWDLNLFHFALHLFRERLMMTRISV